MFLTLRIKVISKANANLDFSGTFLRAFFLRVIAGIDRDLAKRLHNSSNFWGMSPYSTVPLHPIDLGEFLLFPIKVNVVRDSEYFVGFNLVWEVFKDIFPEMLDSFLRSLILINDCKFSPVESYVSRFKYNVNAFRKTLVIFRTPTYFRQIGSSKNFLLPTTEKLVFSMAKIWNAFSEEKFDKAYLEENVIPNIHVIGYRIRTIKPIKLDEKRSVIGFVGKVAYEIDDLESAKIFHKLLSLAKYSNIGGNRTGGFGVINFKAL